MGAAAEQHLPSAEERPLTLRQLLPPGAPATAEELVAGFGLGAPGIDEESPNHPPDPGSRLHPRLSLNMVSTADGHATLGGRSGALSGRADRELFHALRLAVDAVMAGAGTVRAERYGRIIPEESRRRLRSERGLSEEPLACIVSGRLSLEGDIPLLADPAARVVIVTASTACLPACAAEVHYIRAARDGQLDLPAALAELRARFGVRTLLCEGGPHLNTQLLAAELVDELFLSLSPKLAGGDPAAGNDPTGDGEDPAAEDGKPAAGDNPTAGGKQTLRILAGAELSPPLELELLGALEHDSQLFLRYGVRDRPGEASPRRRRSRRDG